jgi:pimeloyl-ACP methyl ester carboxylesterase
MAWDASATTRVQLRRRGSARHHDRHRFACVASARPSAKNPALRSSIRTCTRQFAARSCTPERAASSENRDRSPRREDPTGSIRRTASPRTWPAPRSGSVRSVAMSLLSVQRRRLGPTLVWLHGFTQTKDSAHQFRSILAGTNELLTLDLPGHGENAGISASFDETADLLAEVLPRAIRARRLLLRGPCGAALRAASTPSRVKRCWSYLARRVASTTRTERAERRTSDDEALANRIENRFGCLPRRVARARDVRGASPTTRSSAALEVPMRAGMANSLRLRRNRDAAWLAPELPHLRCRRWRWRGRTTRNSALEATAIADSVSTGQPRYSSRRAGHAAHLEQPEATAGSYKEFLANNANTRTNGEQRAELQLGCAPNTSTSAISSRPFFFENARSERDGYREAIATMPTTLCPDPDDPD